MKPDGFRYGQDAWIYVSHAQYVSKVFIAAKAPASRQWRNGKQYPDEPVVVCRDYDRDGRMKQYGFKAKRSALFRSEADALDAQAKFLLSWAERERTMALENERKALRCEMRAAELRAKTEGNP